MTKDNIAFIIYGVLLNTVPVILTNTILLTINFYYLYKIYNRKEHFELLEFSSGGILVDRFLSFYKSDIALYFPDFTRQQMEGNLNFVVLRDLVIANIFSARVAPDGIAEVIINYTVTKYRDYKVGRFIFDKEKEFLASKGVKSLFYSSVAYTRHEKFLRVMGFKKEKAGEQLLYTRNL